MKPLLRWAGSKRQLLTELKKYVPISFDRYVEPFAGSARLFFDLGHTSAIIGDINSELIDTYRAIQTDWKGVTKALKNLVPDKDTYYELRRINTKPLSPVERAARFIYLNRFCFNGLYRTNSRGEFNVPYSGNGTGRLPTSDELKEVSCSLSDVIFVAGSFEQTLSMVRKGDFVYMDPPYARTNCKSFTEYSARKFGAKELILLRRWMEKLCHQNTSFLVTYEDCPEAEMLSEGFQRHRVRARRCISGFVKSRKTVWDVIICP